MKVLILLALTIFFAAYTVSALSVDNIPNGKNMVHVNGHLWLDVSMPTWRGSSSSAGPTNQFITDLAAASSWSALCSMDSDGDGYTNGEELGDPSCSWTPSSTSLPSRTTDITHPGLWSSVPLKSTFPSKSQSAASSCPAAASSVQTAKQERDAMRGTVAVPSDLVYADPPNKIITMPEPGVTDYSAYGGASNNIYAYDSATCPHLQSGLSLWHDAATWTSGVPAAGSDVTLPANKKVLVRACSVSAAGYNRITIPSTSELIIDDAPVHLRVKEIIVQNGGKLLIGSAKCRIQNPVTFTFFGAKSEISTYGNGISGQNGATVEMWGAEQDRTWSRLRTTAFAGSDYIVVQDPVEWGVGEEIVIVTSIYKDLAFDQNEVRRIIKVDSSKKIFQLDRPLKYKHYGGKEYQIEVGLLWRSVLMRSDPDRAVYDFGGHIEVMGAASTFRAVGIRSTEMGQRNIVARYPFHMHFMFETGGARSCFIGNAVTHSHFRGYTIHGTNSSLIRLNVAFNTTAHTYYFEDGVEQKHHLEFNLGARVHIIGKPASGGAQDGESFTESADLEQPADATSGVYYIPNPENYVVGNAASGGWAGFSVPVFDVAQGVAMSIDTLKEMKPKTFNFLRFDGNSAHSAGYYWGAAGCFYFGGRLWRDSSNNKRYTNGRYSHPTENLQRSGEGWMHITNTKVFLCNKGLGSWGDRIDMRNYEAYDTVRTAVLFGESSLINVHYDGHTPNRPHDMFSEQSEVFEAYDIHVRTILENFTAKNVWSRPTEGYWDRSFMISSIDHSDIFKPSQITAFGSIMFSNIDRQIILRPRVRQTGAYFMTSYNDQYGVITNQKTCKPMIIGSGIDWWNGGDDCYQDPSSNLWICPRIPGREVVAVDIDLPGITVDGYSLDLQTSSETGDYTQAQKDQLYIGHVSQFGSKSNRKITSTRNHHLATGLSGLGWYFWTYDTIGIPTTIKIMPYNFVLGSRILFAISYPAGTTFTISSESKWGSKRQLFWTQVASREAVYNYNGSAYHFDGQHLYLQLSDMWTKNDDNYFFSREGIKIPGSNWGNWFITVVANCPSKNSLGNCATPSSPNPPADMNPLPVTVCSNPDVQLLQQQNLCPQLPCDPTGSGYGTPPWTTCDQYEAGYKCWNTNYCKCVCQANCTRFAYYPYTCSRDFQAECDVSKKPPPVDYCASATSNPINDVCYLSVCNDTNHHETIRPFIGMGAPCTMHHTSSWYNGQTEGYCRSQKCLPLPDAENVDLNFTVSQLNYDHERKGVPSQISVGVVPHPTKFASTGGLKVTRVQALYFASIDSPLTVTTQRILELTQGANSASWWSASTPSSDIRPARNVTIRVWGLGGQTTSIYSSHVFSDWGASSHRNPQVEVYQPESNTLSNFRVKVSPLDWVEKATLRPCGGSSATGVVGTRVAGTADVVSFDATSLSTSAPGGCARVDLVLADKINLQVAVTLPCAFANNGDSCKVSRMSMTRKSSCSVDMVITGNAYWFTGRLSQAGLTPVVVDNLTVIDGDTSCPEGVTLCDAPQTRSTWSIWAFDGRIRAVSTPRMIEIKLSNGKKEYYMMQAPTTTPQFATCVNGTENTEIIEQKPTVSGKCCRNSCLPLDPVTDADPHCPVTTTTTSAPSAAPTTTTTTTTAATTVAAPETTAQQQQETSSPAGTTVVAVETTTTSSNAASSASPSTTTATTESGGVVLTTIPQVEITTTQIQVQVPTTTTTTSSSPTNSPSQQATSSSAPAVVITTTSVPATPAPSTTTTSTTTSVAAPTQTTTTASSSPKYYSIVFKPSLSSDVSRLIIQNNLESLRTALAKDVAALLSVTPYTSVTTQSDISVDISSGEITAKFEVSASVVASSTYNDSPILNLQSSSSWMTNTAPIFTSNSGSSTAVSFTTVSAAAAAGPSTTTAAPSNDDDSAPAHCFIAGNCGASIGVIVGVCVLLIIIVAVIVRRNTKSGTGASAVDYESQNYAVSSQPASLNTSRQKQLYGGDTYHRFEETTPAQHTRQGIEYEDEQELVGIDDYFNNGNNNNNQQSNRRPQQQQQQPRQQRQQQLLLDSDDDLLDEAFSNGLHSTFDNL